MEVVERVIASHYRDGRAPASGAFRERQLAVHADYVEQIADHLHPFDNLYYTAYYDGGMAETITFRPDEKSQRALHALTEDGTPVSTAVREALILAARERSRARIRAQAEASAADPEDRAEMARVMQDMEAIRAW